MFSFHSKNNTKQKNSDSELKIDTPVEVSNEQTKPDSLPKKRKYDTNTILTIVTKVLVILILLLSIIRVPYVGAFFDSVIFSMLFGWTKYVAYAICFLAVILSFFPVIYRQVFKMKNIWITLIIWFLVAVIFSSFGVLTTYRTSEINAFDKFFLGTPNSYIQYWLDNDWSKIGSTTNLFYLNPNGFGGLPAFLFVVVFEIGSPIILIILSIGLIGLILYFIFRKLQKNHKNNKILKSDESTSSKLFLVKQTNFSKQKYAYITKFLHNLENGKHHYPIGKINNLTSTSIDNYNEIVEQVGIFDKKIQDFFTKENLQLKLIDKQIMYKSFLLQYKFLSKADLRSAKTLMASFNATEPNNNEMKYWFDGNVLFITEKAVFDFQISIKEVVRLISDSGNFYCLGIGKFMDRKPYYINSLYEPNLAIYGSTFGDGRSMLLSNIILSLAMLNGPDLISLNMIDLTNKTLRRLTSLPQVKNYITTHDNAKIYFDNLFNEMNERLDLIRKSGCLDIYEYNVKNHHKPYMPVQVIVINNYDELIAWNNSFFTNDVVELLKKSQVVGFVFIILFSVVNENTISLSQYFNNTIALRLSSASESEKLIGDPIAEHLYGNGDMLLKTSDSLYRLQSPYVNPDELSFILDEISNNLIGK